MSQYTLTSPPSFQGTHPVTRLNPISAGLLPTGRTAKSYAKVMNTGRASFRDVPPMQTYLGPILRRAPPLAECSVVSCVRLLINFCHGAPSFHFLLGPANYIARLEYGGG